MGDRAAPLDRIECALGDITLEKVDAIVNAANASLRGGGGVDGAIHRAAGPGLLEECIRLHPDGCPTGDVRPTAGHRLPSRFILHAVGPVYRDGRSGESELLASCHRRALEFAAARGAKTIAFPAISCGVYGYPWPEAAGIALGTTAASLVGLPSIERVRFVLFSAEIHRVFAATLRRMGSGLK